LKRHLYFFLSVLISAASLFGQATTSLRGTVTDSSGAAIAEAVVNLSDPSTGASRKVVTDSKGEYQFLQIMPAKYMMQVEKPGFSTLIQKNIVLEVATPATLDCKLEVGSVGATISVEADASSINTVDASLGSPFTQTQIRQLPLQTRNVVELLSIQPGVTQTGETLGARRDQNNITLDGVDVNDNQNSGISTLNGLANGSNSGGTVTTNNQVVAGFNSALPIPLDSVQEFRVTVAGQGADQGRSSGGQVSLITKSGTNQFHGSAYEYNRNTFLAANNWFNNRSGIKREPLVRNQFGASLGGPVIKNRVFFFGNWERRIDASGKTVTDFVPTESLKQGILTFKASDGTIQRLSPAELVAIDPLKRGLNPVSKTYLAQFPVGNDNTLGSDKGLNFTGLRFNSPFKEDDSAYVAKMDFNLDRARNHTLAVRGTLAGASQDLVVGQYPGQSPVSQQLNNSKGISGLYTWVIKPSLINVATVGFTRLSIAQSGTLGNSLTFDSLTSPTNFTRPSLRRIPTMNYADDLTWTKGTHNIKTGFNFRVIKNQRANYANSFASYSFSRNTLQGLGGDIVGIVNSYIQQRSGNSGLTLSDKTSVVRALGNLYGLVNQYGATYQFNRDGSIIPFGQPAAREFATNEYEGYIQDTWRARRDLTLTYGLRYSNFSVPHETHGIQVGTTIGLDQYFAERVNAANNGIPNNQIKDAALTYILAGPENKGQGFYKRDNNNFGPRVSFAYAPEKAGGHWWSQVLGRGSVLRGGVAMVYDRYGSDLITQFDNNGSPGLASSVTQPSNTNFTTSTRYGATLPALPIAPKGGFPYTPATITGGFDEGVGINPGLVAPYSFVLNLNYAKELPGKVTVEVGYAGRLSRKNLLQQDYNQPLTTFKDPASGQTWTQASGILRDYYEKGLTASQIPKIPFFENQFPALAGAYIKGASATANYFDNVYNQNGGSDLDGLNQVDRDRSDPDFPNCVSKTGCNTFFPLQSAGLPTWTNSGFANYHAGTLTVRRSLANGVAFDFNYTLSHSIDNSSGAESGAGVSGAVLQDAFHPGAFRGSSDFDARHNITMDVLLELPFGKGRKFLGSSPGWVNEIVGGWQVSTLGRYRSGLPSTISNGGIFPTNYENSAIAIVAPGQSNKTSIGFDQNGLPSIFANTSANTNYIGQYPGQTGTRGIVRLAGLTNFDMAFAKSFALPWEGHRLQLRGEAFNAFNNVNFQNPSLSLATPAKFGEFQAALPARVVQLSLRYQF